MKKRANKKSKSSSSDSNLFGAAAYLLGLLTGVIMFLVKPKDSYVKYHAIQSILLTVVIWLLIIIIGTVVGILAVTNPLLWAAVGFALIGLIQVIAIILWLYCMWKAYNGEKFKLPVVGNWAEKHV